MSWYQSGYTGMDKEQERLDSQQGVKRLYIPAGQEKSIVFIDDETFCVHEHNPKMGGNYRNWLTCLQGANDNPVCCKVLGPDSRYYCGYLTVVDCSKWSDKKGNEHQYEMRLIQAKMKTLKKFRRKKESKGTLVAQMYKAIREDDRSPVCGDEFEHDREVDLDKMFGVVKYKGQLLEDLFTEAEEKPETMARVRRTFQIEPEDGKLPRRIPVFNYMELLKPKSPSELQLLLSTAEPSTSSYGGSSSSSNGSSGGGGNAVSSDDVPF